MKALFALAALFSNVSLAANFSFTGSFNQDSQIEYFAFTLAANGTVTLQTFGYGGGTNAASQVISAGGFDPILSVFDTSTDLLIGLNNDGTCPPGTNDPSTNACWDSTLALPLTAGTYIVALTQNDNQAFGPFLADGFSRTGQGNFTCDAFGGPPGGGFCDQNPAQRTSSWALDILNADTAVSIPEPGAWSLIGIGLAAMAAMRLRAAHR